MTDTTPSIAELASVVAHLAQALANHEQNRVEVPPQRAMPERVLLTAEEAAERLRIGRTLMFRLIRTGEIESVLIGRLRRVPASAVDDYAQRLVSGQTQANAA